MTIACPVCEREMDGPPDVKALGYAQLAPQERTVLNALIKAYPRAIRIESIISALYGNDPNGGPDDPNQVIRVRIMQLRRLLPHYGWNIPKSGAGRGHYGEYRLEKLRA